MALFAAYVFSVRL